MKLQVEPSSLPEVLIIKTPIWTDERGFWRELWQEADFRAAGVSAAFVQDSHSRSRQGVVRGLHYQWPCPQGKLISVCRGEIFDVAVDIRPASPTFGQHVSRLLRDDSGEMLFIPPGFAHGFCVLSDCADVCYKCSDYYRAEYGRGVAWDDPDLAIAWPVANPILSPRDRGWPRLRELLPSALPVFRGEG